jgi:PAS domain S-box-containing protein
MVLIADDAGRYLAATRTAAERLGVDLAEISDMTVADVTPPDDRADVPARWQAFLAAGQPRGVVSLRSRDGRETVVEFRAVANTPEVGLHVSRLRPASATLTTGESPTATFAAGVEQPRQ